MTDDERPQGSLWWIVVFRKHSKIFTYCRTLDEMTNIVADHKARTGVYPYQMWAIIDDEMKKVVIA